MNTYKTNKTKTINKTWPSMNSKNTRKATNTHKQRNESKHKLRNNDTNKKTQGHD